MEQAVKAIAMDLDGTALTEKKVFSEKLQKVLKTAKEYGTEIIIATGRCLASLPDGIMEVPGLHYVITSNGAIIYEFPEQRILYSNCIKKEKVQMIRELLQGEQLDTEVFFDGNGYLNKEYFQRILDGKTCRTIEYVKRTRHTTEDVFALMEQHQEQIENIAVYFDCQKEKERIREKLLQIPGIWVTSAFPDNIELGDIQTSKGAALKELLKICEISAEDLFAIGDGENDLEMLEFAGIGVAMGNARECVKEAADFVTATNEEDGVACAIQRFVIDKEKKNECTCSS